jgi:hypothetical protein
MPELPGGEFGMVDAVTGEIVYSSRLFRDCFWDESGGEAHIHQHMPPPVVLEHTDDLITVYAKRINSSCSIPLWDRCGVDGCDHGPIYKETHKKQGATPVNLLNAPSKSIRSKDKVELYKVAQGTVQAITIEELEECHVNLEERLENPIDGEEYLSDDYSVIAG